MIRIMGPRSAQTFVISIILMVFGEQNAVVPSHTIPMASSADHVIHTNPRSLRAQ